jgi:prepilin-type N-terminal cleavage/methylation domain-containing protein
MNNKGFTLVELLATIVIISILGVIAYTSVSSYIKTSQDKAEDKFLDEVSTEVESYISLYSGNFKTDKTSPSYNFDKVVKSSINAEGTAGSDVTRAVTGYKMIRTDGNEFTLSNIINDLKTTEKFVNPKTNKECSASEVKISVFMDSDFVYYYYVDFNGTDTSDGECDVPKRKNINTLPANFQNAICDKDNSWGFCNGGGSTSE